MGVSIQQEALLELLRNRPSLAVALLVLTLSRGTARWARQPIDIGHPGFELRPLVIGPDEVPTILNPDKAQADPELAVLSAMAHGRGPSWKPRLTP
jgi:hypothetical protein